MFIGRAVTVLASLVAMVSRAALVIVTLRVYPSARHGFDVASIPAARTVRLVPLIGPSATIGFDADASRSAAQELAQLLRENLR